MIKKISEINLNKYIKIIIYFKYFFFVFSVLSTFLFIFFLHFSRFFWNRTYPNSPRKWHLQLDVQKEQKGHTHFEGNKKTYKWIFYLILRMSKFVRLFSFQILILHKHNNGIMLRGVEQLRVVRPS